MAFFGNKPETPPSPQTPSTHPPPPPERTASPPAAPASAPSPTVAPAAATVIGARVKLVGDLSGDEDILINGRVEGKIRVDRKVVVSTGAEIEGDVQAKSVVIGGRINGQVTAADRAELLASGRVQGNVHAPRIVMAEGAQIQGRVVMPTNAATRPLSPPPPPKTEEAPKKTVSPPKPEDTARPPASPGSGG